MARNKIYSRKRNTIPARIDIDLKLVIDDFAFKNNLTFSQASSEIAKTLKELKIRRKKTIKELKF